MNRTNTMLRLKNSLKQMTCTFWFSILLRKALSNELFIKMNHKEKQWQEVSFFRCSLPLSDLQAHGENLDLRSCTFDINYANTRPFQKYFREPFSEYHSSSLATMTPHCKGERKCCSEVEMENRKKVSVVANQGHLKILVLHL